MLHKLERHLGWAAIPNLSLCLVAGQVMVFLFVMLMQFRVELIALLPAAVLHGEVWRLFTYLLVPPTSGQLTAFGAMFLAFGWYMFFLMGRALEDHWGNFRYNAFIFTGWLLTASVAFLTPGSYATNAFLAGSVFLAFAFLNPDFEIYVFFILPVKIKWLALLTWILYGVTFALGNWTARLAVLAAVGNFLLFFARDIVDRAAAPLHRVRQDRADAPAGGFPLRRRRPVLLLRAPRRE
jgi:membrane associated rhomboid family serine protease